MICRATRGGEVVDARPRAFHCVLRAEPLSVRRTLADMRRVMEADASEDALGRLELVLAEILNNIVEHGLGVTRDPEAILAEARAEGAARAGTVHLLVRADADGMRCVITDTGVLLPGECLAPRSLPRCEPDLPEGGFGWYLIQDLVRELSYSRRGGRNVLAFTLPAEEEVAAA